MISSLSPPRLSYSYVYSPYIVPLCPEIWVDLIPNTYQSLLFKHTKYAIDITQVSSIISRYLLYSYLDKLEILIYLRRLISLPSNILNISFSSPISAFLYFLYNVLITAL